MFSETIECLMRLFNAWWDQDLLIAWWGSSLLGEINWIGMLGEAVDSFGCQGNPHMNEFTPFTLPLHSAATTAERFFRIDRSQESLHYITDISSEDLYILDPELSPRVRLSPGPAGAGAPNGHGETTPSAISHRSCISASSSALSFAFPVTPPKSPAFLQWVIWLAIVVYNDFVLPLAQVVCTLGGVCGGWGMWGVTWGWLIMKWNCHSRFLFPCKTFENHILLGFWFFSCLGFWVCFFTSELVLGTKVLLFVYIRENV